MRERNERQDAAHAPSENASMAEISDRLLSKAKQKGAKGFEVFSQSLSSVSPAHQSSPSISLQESCSFSTLESTSPPSYHSVIEDFASLRDEERDFVVLGGDKADPISRIQTLNPYFSSSFSSIPSASPVQTSSIRKPSRPTQNIFQSFSSKKKKSDKEKMKDNPYDTEEVKWEVGKEGSQKDNFSLRAATFQKLVSISFDLRSHFTCSIVGRFSNGQVG